MFMRMIYDESLAQAAYLIGCQKTGEAVIIDPERDVDRYIELATQNELRIVATAETHIHADFVSGSRELAEQVGAHVYVSDEGDSDWKYQWLDQKVGGGAYLHTLLKDGDSFQIGNIELRVMHTPGHTPEHIVFLITDHGSGATEPMAMASGDFVFVGDLGRPDLLESAAGLAGMMEPSARRLFATTQRLQEIPDFVQVWPAHGAGSACGKALGAVPMSTVGYERRFNPALLAATSEQCFVDFILEGQPEPPLYFANMKRDNKIGPPVLGGLPSPSKMDASDLRMLDRQQVALIDTRPWEAFQSGHVPSSMSFPIINSFNTNVGSMVRDTDDIYLVIAPEYLEDAIRSLIRVGLDRVRGWVDASEVERYSDSAPDLAGVAEICAEDAAAIIDAKEIQVLDVRRKTEFECGHLPGAINIAHTRLASRLEEIPKNTRLLVNCHSGVRSAMSCAFLMRQGFQVVNLKGGYLAWEQLTTRV
jgi:hydroxyacylglutathione hydrolase